MWTYRNDAELQDIYQDITGEQPTNNFIRLISAVVPLFERQLGYDLDTYEPKFHQTINYMLVYYVRDVIKGRYKSEKIGDYSYTRDTNKDIPEWVPYYKVLQHVGDYDVT